MTSPGPGCPVCGHASLSGIAAGADGNIWFVDVGQQSVGRISPSGIISYVAVPGTVGGPETISVGPDGNIWTVALEEGHGFPSSILRISPSGAIKDFKLATGAGPDGITAGPDGNIWFTEYFASRIGRMTTAGVITEFALGPNSSPRGIATGPDGNLWFTEARIQGSAIAKITVTGKITEFPLGGTPTNQLNPTAVVAGPDGNVWFSEYGNLGRITPTGHITLYPLNSVGSPGGLAKGPDGNIWFTNAGGNTVGRMSPIGVKREFALPRPGAGPLAVAAGRDGRLWFTEPGVGRIASIGVTVPEAKLSSRVLTFARGSATTTHEITITNTGDADLVIASHELVGSDQSSFAATRDDCTDHRVAVNASCQIEVAFTPSSNLGVRAARLAITDNATGSPQSVSLVAQPPNCRLPLFEINAPPSISSGAFLNLRDGSVIEDPKATFETTGTHSQSVTEPILNGQLPARYDPAAARWVPGSAISPDGSRYAYADYPQGSGISLHVVDVAMGHDLVLPVPSGPWRVLSFNTEGIFVNQSFEGIGQGLSLVNPDSGAIRTIFTDAAVPLVADGRAWIVARDKTDPLPGPPGIGGANNEIQSRDLNTLQTTTWIYRSGFGLNVTAASDGSIIVGGSDGRATYLWQLSGPGQAVPITLPETDDALPISAAPIGDANGWWIGSLNGVYLWTPRTGAILVSALLASPAGTCD